MRFHPKTYFKKENIPVGCALTAAMASTPRGYALPPPGYTVQPPAPAGKDLAPGIPYNPRKGPSTRDTPSPCKQINRHL